VLDYGIRLGLGSKRGIIVMKTNTGIASFFGLLLLGAEPVSAHHSFAAAYDVSEPITIKGTIVDIRLTNPHSLFSLDVVDEEGNTVRWSFEAGTPSGMIRNGYSPNLIKKGDEVTITGFHARDRAANAGMLRELVTADGTVYGMFGPQQNPDAK
jgi:DNA/RNA endonuclease YhcR with UshA esterase domain